MKWLTIKLMELQLKRVKKQRLNIDNDIVSQAYGNMIKTYKDSIMFLKANN